MDRVSGEGGTPKYSTKEFSFNDLNKNGITVPKFQRGLVWSESAKKAFIQTIANGFPFGSILLYETTPKHYSIIDGLQRFSALKSFQKNPGSYWSGDNKKIWLPKLCSVFEQHNVQLDEADIKSTFDELVESPNRNGDSISILTRHTPLDKTFDAVIDYQKFVKELDQAINSFINLDLVKIPAIIFTGTADELATVFENLNKTGTKLTKYQVFSASWQDQMLHLDNSEYSKAVLEILSRRYQDLQSSDVGRGLEIDGYDTDTFKKDAQINLAEFAYALGALILNKVPSLYRSGDDAPRDTIGFYALAIATKTDNRHLEDAIKQIDYVQANHQEILSRMSSIAENINRTFEQYLRKPTYSSSKKSAKAYENGMNSDLKFLSYVAAMWSSGQDQSEQRLTMRNLPAYFISDDLKNLWSGSGDSRLSTFYENSSNEGKAIANYLTALTKEQLDKTFLNWVEEDAQSPSISFSRRVKCLATIHANCTYGSFILPGSKPDFEHIIAKKLLGRHLSNGKMLYAEEGLCGGAIGNIMLLNDANNREKQTSNLWEDALSNSKSHEASAAIVNNPKYIQALSYPDQATLAKAQEGLKIGDVETAKAVIVSRGRAVMMAIAERLGK